MAKYGFIKGCVLMVILHSATVVVARQIEVYTPVPSDAIKVEASSEFSGFNAEETINGSGMKNHFHSSQNLGKSMWISKVSDSPVQAKEQTHQGVVWLLYEFDKMRKLDLIEIWNHNQNDHTNRGLQKVYLQYSNDGKSWNTLKDGRHDYFIIPKSAGRKEEPADFRLKLDGLELKYFCITADLQEGNYYHDHSEQTLTEAQWKNQDPNYYGLSEIRFYEKIKKDVAKLEKINDVFFAATQGYRKTTDGPRREFKIKFDRPLFTGGEIEVSFLDKKQVEKIPASEMGLYEFSSLFPSGLMEEAVHVDFTFKSRQGSIKKNVKIEAARKWEVYFLPHSHLDIGYTHRHAAVMNRQLRNLERAIELSEKTKDYPEGSRFRWNAEAMWPVTEYLERYKGSTKIQSFKEAVKNGSIGLNASIGNILTGLCTQEETMHLFDDAHRAAMSLDIDIDAAMISDVPGVSWGMVTAMADNGVKYFSMAPNYVPFLETGGSRVGLVHKEWGDYPFYWRSESGDEKVLCWSAGKGYSFFHDWLAGDLSSCGLDPIWEYLNELEVKQFPYDMAYLRYTINGDNGPPDPEMSDIIRKWNETYEYPKFCISTTHELFARFEQRYADKLPAFSGDLTPYWEEGAASTAAELTMNRYNSDELNQLEILWSMVNPSLFPADDFYHAWRNVALFSEHTWGASASGVEPEAEFTKDLWREKRSFALKADSVTKGIFQKFTADVQAKTDGTCIQVFNTNLWPRTDVVKLSTPMDLSSKSIVDENDQEVSVQKTGDNKWIFIAEDVKPLSSKVYRIITSGRKKEITKTPFTINDNTITNGIISVSINKENGAISSLYAGNNKMNYAAGNGLNEYVYTGRNASSPQYVESVKEIIILNEGPVAVTLRVLSDAPGCNSLTRDITLYKGINRVDISNILDKKNVPEPENVRFGFSFSIPYAETVIDLPFSEIRPEREQLSGANKNFYSVNNGVTVSGMRHSVLLTTVGTPVVEIGAMNGEAWRKDSKEFLAWNRAATSSPTIYSWVMNNSWSTNYKASQDGKAVFDYSIIPLTPYSHESKQKSVEVAQPLRAVLSGNADPYKTLFTLEGNNKIAVSTIRASKDHRGYLIRLVNLSNQSVHSSFNRGSIMPQKISECDNREQVIKEWKNGSFWMKPYGTLTLKVE